MANKIKFTKALRSFLEKQVERWADATETTRTLLWQGAGRPEVRAQLKRVGEGHSVFCQLELSWSGRQWSGSFYGPTLQAAISGCVARLSEWALPVAAAGTTFFPPMAASERSGGLVAGKTVPDPRTPALDVTSSGAASGPPSGATRVRGPRRAPDPGSLSGGVTPGLRVSYAMAGGRAR